VLCVEFIFFDPVVNISFRNDWNVNLYVFSVFAGEQLDLFKARMVDSRSCKFLLCLRLGRLFGSHYKSKVNLIILFRIINADSIRGLRKEIAAFRQ
jgi:hypothetical protein